MDEYDCVVGEIQQRIALSRIVYIVYDIVTTKVKEYKVDLLHTVDDDDDNEEPANENSTIVETSFSESNVSLFRYGGFALHSLIQKYRERASSNSADSEARDILCILEVLKIKSEDSNSVPYGIQCLNQGGLVIIDPCLLAYLRLLIDKVLSHINEKQCQEMGQHMIKVARMKIENDTDIRSLFMKCLDNINSVGTLPDSASLPAIDKVYKEFTLKIFHARVNEYMTATAEIELEKSGKAVKADQSLRDQLKTYSSTKGR